MVQRWGLMVAMLMLGLLLVGAQSEPNATMGEYLNDIPERFDDTQLWRVHNLSIALKQSIPVGAVMEQKFGGNIWKENSKFLDISIAKEHVKAARSFLQAHHLDTELLSNNVQALIDEELLEGARNRQSLPGARTKKATQSSGMHWRDYQSLDVIYDYMREIRAKYPDLVRIYTIGKSVEGRDLKVLRITNNARGNKKIWIDGGIHAREWISPATVTYILNQLMGNWDTHPAAITSLTWYVMPVMNPDGYEYSRRVNRLWRKNRSRSLNGKCFGVDLNRNFDIGWSGYGSSTDPCSDIYRGREPASEPETQAVVQFLTKRKNGLTSYLTYHSYGQMIVYPWAYKAVKVRDYSDLQRVASGARNRIEKTTGARYTAAATHEVLGVAGGGSDDWSRDSLGVKYVYTVELRDKGIYGFVLPPKFIKDTIQEGWIVAQEVALAIE